MSEAVTAEPKLEFIKTLRDCGFNQKQPPGSRRLIYDYHVMVDGEHRATFKSEGNLGVGYRFVDAEGRAIFLGDKPSLIELGACVRAKHEFKYMARTALLKGRIPTAAQIAQRVAEREQTQAARSAAEADERRERMRELAVPEMYAALQLVLHWWNNKDGTTAVRDRDAAIKAAKAAIAKADTP